MTMQARPAPLALSVRDAAGVAGISRTLIYREISEGRLPIKKAGRRTLIEFRALEAWLAALPQRTAA